MQTLTNGRLKSTQFEKSLQTFSNEYLPTDIDKVTHFKKRLEEYILDEEEDLIADLSQIVPDSRPYNREKYDSILLNAHSSRAICQKFGTEPSGLVKSDAKGYDFSLKNILERMNSGHKVYKYNYNTAARKIVNVKIINGVVEIYTSETRKNRIGFADFCGVLIGARTSTFRMYKFHVDYSAGELHTPEDCFSIVNELRSYDFASISSLARYDICISLSWVCSLNNPLQCCIPFTKCKFYSDFLSIYTIRGKLEREASLRFISLQELFFVMNI